MRFFLSYLSIAMVASIGPVAAQQDTAFKSRFEGTYAGVTGGYDFATTDTRQAVAPAYIQNYYPGLTYPEIPRNSLQGAKVGVLSGYNSTAGDVLVGIEARGQYQFAKAQRASEYHYASDFTWIGSADIGFNNKRQREWQFDLVGRLGLIRGDWLVFGKLGLGIEQAVAKNYTETTVSCAAWMICIPQTYHSAYSNTARKWVGYGIVGAGVERNFGPIFARLEGELIAHELSYYTPAANLTLGYRF